ncbi:Outer-membrane lipoprotein carrier protein [Thalassocella blandensis]|nr:Outer-membrane lipoprotein carrier protein [Thalassocella blandensis]
MTLISRVIFAGALLYCSVGSALVFAEKSDSAESFTEILASFETLQGNFVQKIKDPDGKLVQETKGEFKVKRPGYFLWKIAPPYEQIVAGTPEKLKIYDPDLEQLTVHQNDSLAGSPALLISGDVKAIEAQYNIEKQSSKNIYSFVLKNKQTNDSSFESMTFVFKKSGKAFVLNAMSFADKLGQTTDVSLDKVKTNISLGADVFEFSPPPGTDIIVNDP